MSLLQIYKQSDGTVPTTSNALGLNSYLLVTATRYIIPLAGIDQTTLGAHVQWDANIIITSITVEDCSIPIEAFASDAFKGSLSIAGGVWIVENPSTAFVGLHSGGVGASVSNGVVAVAGGTQGGCHFHIVDTGAIRTRLNILVGVTGGVIRIGGNVKKK